MKLFREEVSQAHAALWLGAVRLHRPVFFTVLTVAALGMALTLVAFAAWDEINSKARLTGLLAPNRGNLSIPAPQAGVVRQLPAVEGPGLHRFWASSPVAPHWGGCGCGCGCG